MKKIKLISLFLFSIALVPVNAQNAVDALRYSQLTFGGTARYMSMAGAFGAVGADFSTLSTNPAGIGLYKKSEFTISPSVYWANTKSLYNGYTNEDSRANFNLSNAGMVIAYDIEKNKPGSEWKNMQFGFGINRHNNFNNRMRIEGQNMDNSLLTAYENYANGTYYEDLYTGQNAFDIGPAFDTYLLDTISGSSNYRNAMPSGGVLQRKSIDTRGSTNEFLFSMGGNYNDRLYIGATIGIPFARYIEESIYSEEALADSIGYDEFKEFAVREKLEASGSGFNFKFGLIFRAQDWLRLGAAIHTPTYFNMHENWESRTESNFDNGDSYYSNSPYGEYEYRLNTPWRAIGSIAFIIGKIGVISADYEFVDYSNAKFKTKRNVGVWDDFQDVNYDIRENYTTAHSIRVGTEWRINHILLRGGYAIYGSPYKSGVNDGERTSFTAGFGFREKFYFIDFAYVYTKTNEDYYLYDKEYMDPVKPANNEIIYNNIVATLGFRF